MSSSPPSSSLPITLITTFGPLVADLVAGLVHRIAPAVEAKNGPGTGPVKIVDLNTLVTAELQKARASGTIAVMPDAMVIQIAVQAVVSSLKLQGALSPNASPPAAFAPTKTISLKAGDSVSIIVT